MDEIMKFFDFAQPCPQSIKDCELIRSEYGRDLDEARKRGGCNTCIERNLRQQYIIKLQALLGQ